jgi:hypothetical protein
MMMVGAFVCCNGLLGRIRASEGGAHARLRDH